MHAGRTSSSNEYRYRWIVPAIRGIIPAGRLAHAAAVVRVLDGGLDGVEGAADCVKETFMVVFGGVGTGTLYNDTHVLRCAGSSQTADMRFVAAALLHAFPFAGEVLIFFPFLRQRFSREFVAY